MKVEITRYKSGKRAGSIKKKDIRIDYHDSWCVSWSLAQIAAPLVKQLKETGYGFGRVPKHLVLEHLHSTYGSAKDYSEDYSKEAWDWALDEIVFAMEEIANNNANEPSFHTKVGEMNFLPIDPKTKTGKLDFVGWESTSESEAANAAYHERVQKGCELLGHLFTTLWD